MGAQDEDRGSTLGDLGWRIVGLLNLYRLLLPPVLFAIYRFTLPQPTIGSEHPRLFFTICVLYFLAGLALVLAQRLPRLPGQVLLLAHALVDAVAIGAAASSSSGSKYRVSARSAPVSAANKSTMGRVVSGRGSCGVSRT